MGGLHADLHAEADLLAFFSEFGPIELLKFVPRRSLPASPAASPSPPASPGRRRRRGSRSISNSPAQSPRMRLRSGSGAAEEPLDDGANAYAFVRYCSRAAAIRAIEQANGARLGPARIRVQFTEDVSNKLQRRSRTEPVYMAPPPLFVPPESMYPLMQPIMHVGSPGAPNVGPLPVYFVPPHQLALFQAQPPYHE